MKKSKDAKALNRLVKKINRDLIADVFNDRFWVRQCQKARVNDIDYFLYELKDRKDPSRDLVISKWITIYDAARILYEELNNFIISSNFWETYKK